MSSIVATAFSAAVSVVGTVYLFSGPGVTPREAVGCLMGAALVGTMSGRTVILVAERAVVRDRQEREQMDRQRERAREEQRAREARERAELALDMGLVAPDTSGPIPMTPPMYPLTTDVTDLTEPMARVDGNGRPTDPTARMVDDAVTRYLEEAMEDRYPTSRHHYVEMPLAPRVEQPQAPEGWERS